MAKDFHQQETHHFGATSLKWWEAPSQGYLYSAPSRLHDRCRRSPALYNILQLYNNVRVLRSLLPGFLGPDPATHYKQRSASPLQGRNTYKQKGAKFLQVPCYFGKEERESMVDCVPILLLKHALGHNTYGAQAM